MSDERKGREELIQHIGYVFNECQRWSGYDSCLKCHKGELCKQVLQQIRQLIQQKPEINKAYVEEKAREAYYIAHNQKDYIYALRGCVRQVISDAKGKKEE